MTPTTSAQLRVGAEPAGGTEPGGPICEPCRGGGNSPDGRHCWACDGTGDPYGFDRCEHSTEQVGDREFRCWKCGADQTVMEAEEENDARRPLSVPRTKWVMALEAALPVLERASRHYDCEDCWYSCATLTCDDSRRSDICDCAATEAQLATIVVKEALGRG